ncbi:MAG: efflux RND transporter periplasmic adaptor subunit [Desertifilum sp.]|nr:efflux RND transporter periplasmic adaptor subunit [Desertifilum sp.]
MSSLDRPSNEPPLLNEPAYNPEPPSSIENLEKPQKKPRLNRFWWLIPLVGVVFAIGGISFIRLRDKYSQEITVAEPAPLTVRTVTAERDSIQAWISSEGTVQAVRFKHLAFDVDGDVTFIASRDGRTLRAGDAVRQGELLAQIDDRTLQADINQAEAAVNEAQRQRGVAAANIAQMESQVAAARAQVAQAEAQVAQAQAAQNLAQTELQRYQQLFEQGVISASDLDNRRSTVQDAATQVAVAQAQVAAAQAQVSTAQAQVSSAREQLQATESQIATARARLNQAEVALEGTRLYAPFDGIVAYLNIRENEYYSLQAVSSQLGNYQELLNRVPIVIVDPSQFEVVADLSAGMSDSRSDPYANRVRPGSTALVTEARSPQAGQSGVSLTELAEIQGSIYAVNPAVSPGNRAIQATARIASGSANLQHGASVTLWIAVAEQVDTVVVPLNAIAFRDRVPYVFAVNPETNTVEQRQVELGIEGFDRREILSGVQAGEQLVTEGQSGLVNGARVQVIPSVSPHTGEQS